MEPRNIVLITTLLLAFIQVYDIQAQSTVKIKTYKVTIQGSSSLHDWESDVTKVEWKGFVQVENSMLVYIKDAEVKILVESIKSTKGKMMDNKTYEAFNYEKHPFITYSLNEAKINAAGSIIETKGNLSMAGTTKNIDLLVRSKVLANGDIQLIASKKINMREFGMEPPTAMMGTIKVGEDVTIYFEIVLSSHKSV